jgi:hypothetical protein
MGLLYVHTLQYTYPASTASIMNVQYMYVRRLALLWERERALILEPERQKGRRAIGIVWLCSLSREYTTIEKTSKGNS